MLERSGREAASDGMPPWIKALVATAALALIANAVFVWISLSGRRDLVRRDYYAAGLEQDSRLARRALAAAHRVELTGEGGAWSVTAVRLPAFADRIPGDSGKAPSPPPTLEGAACRVSFQRPEDGREDQVVELAWMDGTTTEGTWRGTAKPLRQGLWNILIEWERDGKVFMESAFPRTLGAGAAGGTRRE